MTQYIDKDAVIAKIEELDEFYHFYKSPSGLGFVERLLSFINTLEIKEVDLNLEITLWANAIPEIQLNDVERLAKYFFELGLQAKSKII